MRSGRFEEHSYWELLPPGLRPRAIHSGGHIVICRKQTHVWTISRERTKLKKRSPDKAKLKKISPSISNAGLRANVKFMVLLMQIDVWFGSRHSGFSHMYLKTWQKKKVTTLLGLLRTIRLGSCHKRQNPQAPTPQAQIRNRQTRKVANAKICNR